MLGLQVAQGCVLGFVVCPDAACLIVLLLELGCELIAQLHVFLARDSKLGMLRCVQPGVDLI